MPDQPDRYYGYTPLPYERPMVATGRIRGDNVYYLPLPSTLAVRDLGNDDLASPLSQLRGSGFDGESTDPAYPARVWGGATQWWYEPGGGTNIETMWTWVSQMSDEAARELAESWAKAAAHLAGTSASLRSHADALATAWQGPARDVFLFNVGAALSSIDEWAAIALTNAATLNHVADTIATAQRRLGTLYEAYLEELAAAEAEREEHERAIVTQDRFSHFPGLDLGALGGRAVDFVTGYEPRSVEDVQREFHEEAVRHTQPLAYVYTEAQFSRFQQGKRYAGPLVRIGPPPPPVLPVPPGAGGVPAAPGAVPGTTLPAPPAAQLGPVPPPPPAVAPPPPPVPDGTGGGQLARGVPAAPVAAGPAPAPVPAAPPPGAPVPPGVLPMPPRVPPRPAGVAPGAAPRVPPPPVPPRVSPGGRPGVPPALPGVSPPPPGSRAGAPPGQRPGVGDRGIPPPPPGTSQPPGRRATARPPAGPATTLPGTRGLPPAPPPGTREPLSQRGATAKPPAPAGARTTLPGVTAGRGIPAPPPRPETPALPGASRAAGARHGGAARTPAPRLPGMAQPGAAGDGSGAAARGRATAGRGAALNPNRSPAPQDPAARRADGKPNGGPKQAGAARDDGRPRAAEREVVPVPGTLDDELWEVEKPPAPDGVIDTPAERPPAPRPATLDGPSR